MTSHSSTIRQFLILLTGLAFVALMLLLMVPSVDALPDRGSIRNSNSAGVNRAGIGNPGGVRNPRGARNPRGIADPRGAADSRNRYDRREDHWEDARRDYYRYRTINTLLRMGAYYASLPRTTTTVVVTGTTYYYSSGVYYVNSGTGYVVVAAPPSAVVYAVPTSTTVVYVGSTPYYYYGGTYYVQTTATAPQPEPAETTINVNINVQSDASEQVQVSELPMTDDEQNYQVVAPPVGATVPYLPNEATAQTVEGKKYYVFEGAYYRPFVSDGETIYMVVSDPT